MSDNHMYKKEPTILNSKEFDWLWQYRNHQDNIFYERMHFFLVAESMLFVAFTTVIASQEDKLLLVGLTIAMLGFVLTSIWLRVNLRQKQVFEHVRNYVAERWPEYKMLRSDRKIEDKELRWRLGGRIIIATWLPILMLVAWGAVYWAGVYSKWSSVTATWEKRATIVVGLLLILIFVIEIFLLILFRIRAKRHIEERDASGYLNNASDYYNIACIYYLKNEKDLAIESLERAIKKDPAYRVVIKFKAKDDFDNICECPKFQDLFSSVE